MARPIKEGLDYFPLDIDIDQDDKLVVPIGKYGMQGFGIIIRIMSEIYKNCYFYPWTEKEQYAVSLKVNVDINLVNEIINECAKWGFFNQKLLLEHRVLTSRGFQRRYIDAAQRRKSITLIDIFVLVDLAEESEKVTIVIEDVNGNRVNVYIKPVKVNAMHTENTQSKGKESIGKKKVQVPLPRQPRSYAEDDPYYRMATYFHERLQTFVNEIGKGHLVQNPNMQTWADDFRKIIELDKRPRSELGEVVNWATSDSFWRQNILCPDKLRKKYTELCLKMASKGSLSNSHNANDRLFEKNKIEAQKIMEAMEREGVGDQAFVLEN
jgi:hypothetical protein